jgi:hypothetical protein
MARWRCWQAGGPKGSYGGQPFDAWSITAALLLPIAIGIAAATLRQE